MAGDALHMHEHNGTQWSDARTRADDATVQVVSPGWIGARTRDALSVSNKLILFRSPVDPQRWPSLSMTRLNLNGGVSTAV
jgi:hypothetical protein